MKKINIIGLLLIANLSCFTQSFSLLYKNFEPVSTGVDTTLFITEWSVTDQLVFPAGNAGTYNSQIDFGDGTGWYDITSYNDADLTHTYSEAGTYQVSVKGTFPYFAINNTATSKLLLDKVIQWGYVNFATFYGAFYGAANLTSIPISPITGCESVTDYGRAFANTAIDSVSEDMFINSGAALTMIYIFQSTSQLHTIPSGLLRKQIHVTNFAGAFQQKLQPFILPAGLLDSCVSATNFTQFCYLSTGLQKALFQFPASTINIGDRALRCANLNEVNPDIFDLCVNVTNGTGLLYGTSSLTSVADSLLWGLKNATILSNCFRNSAISALPSLDSCIAVQNLSGFAYNCDNVTNVVSISNNDQVTDLTYFYYDCASLTGSSGEYWLNPSGATNYTLTSPLYDTGVPNGLDCYFNCTNLTDYSTIPDYWK